MSSATAPGSLVQYVTTNRVTTLTMNMPARLNGWTEPMLRALRDAFTRAAADEGTAVVVLTGTDPYYSAGVNFSGSFRLNHPKKLHAYIVERNQALFDLFLDFPKPILVAVNGPAIGAVVTSATLCDTIFASEKATFSTPFARLGALPEGCSTVHLPRIIGEANAERMLRAEGWKPTAAEALEIGLVERVTPHEDLLGEAQCMAEEWVEAGRVRTFPAGSTLEELKAVNASESMALAGALLSAPFLMGQYRFLWSRKKRVPALTFLALRTTHPLWSRLL